MLIRTNHSKCKLRLAFIVRVVLFFSIPTVYIISRGTVNNVEEDHVTTRHLLGLLEQGNTNCTPPAILEFPSDGLTRDERQMGFIAIHCVLAIYCFLLLSVVCEEYFVPAIGIMCEKFSMPEDIVGATFMAAASSSPELFINCVGTFITEGDIGVGAIVGSAVFNVLAVPACCGLISGKVINLDWWSVSRDCLMYAVSVIALILTLLDDKIYWHEALFLVIAYTFYILAMIFNGKLGRFAKSSCCGNKKQKLYTEITPLLIKDKNSNYSNGEAHSKINMNQVITMSELEKGSGTPQSDLETSTSSLWSWQDKKSIWKKLLWLIQWPLTFVLWTTIPDCQKHPKLYPLTFFICVCWIGGVSYIVAWIITIIGDTANIPDSVTGLTVLAAGTSLPEAVSSIVVTNQGHGSMGISNSIGSNTFDILLCLGLPWFIKALFYPSTPGNYWVTINSSGLSYSAIFLLSSLLALYGALALNRFRLDWRVGLACTAVYMGFITLAVLIELNVFVPVNLPTCFH